jgi:hypothetical protein
MACGRNGIMITIWMVLLAFTVALISVLELMDR